MLRERIYSKYIQMKICILQNLRLTTTKCAHILITLVFCRIIYRTIFIVVRWCGEQYQRRLMVLGTLTKRMVQVSLCLCLWCGAINVYSVLLPVLEWTLSSRPRTKVAKYAWRRGKWCWRITPTRGHAMHDGGRQRYRTETHTHLMRVAESTNWESFWWKLLLFLVFVYLWWTAKWLQRGYNIVPDTKNQPFE